MNILGKMVYTPLDSKPVGQIESVELDLADLNSVEKCAQELLAKESKLDIFFANAGIMAL
jgi:NADP-dependent 3-hydroxy acid dehydrogenase YdfG